MRPTPLALLSVSLLLTPKAHPQWTPQDAHTTADLRGIHSLGNGVAWASGTNGTILRTEDAGLVWQLCTIPPNAEHLDFRAIQAFDNNTAIVMSSGKGDLSRLYKTTDGCRTWKLLLTNPDKEGFWDALKFKDLKFGALLGDPVAGHFALFLTFDGGVNWVKDAMLVDSHKDEGAFAASNTSLILRDQDTRFFCTGGPSPRIVGHWSGFEDAKMKEQFTDPKLGWTTTLHSTSLEKGPGSSLTQGCYSLAEHEGVQVAVGGDYGHPERREYTAWTDKILPRTKDFAMRTATTPPHGYRSAIAYDAPHKTWITVGPNGTDISTDDGRHWRPLRPNLTAGDTPDADQHWNALSLPFVVGPHGRVATLRPDTLPTPGSKAQLTDRPPLQ